jgi:predicted small lipoprotein YifL
MARSKYWIPACAGMTGPSMSRYLLALTLTLAACGQSGDLYLPSDAPAPAPDSPTPPPAAPEEQKKKESQ